MKRTIHIQLLIAMSFLLASSGIALMAAPPPDRIHYQGVLRDSANNPLDGNHDMVFRFFDADVGGNEILVDTHDALGGLPVTVSDGLFGVDLGAGVMTDGSGAGTYASLTEVFRDHSATWVSIEVDGEVLAPRVEVVSAGYALNADHLDGMDSTSFLTSESDPQVGVLTATKWCSSDGTEIDCTEEVPIAVENDPQVGTLGTNEIPKWDGTSLVSGAIFDVGGNVGIGTASPQSALDVSGAVNTSVEYRFEGDRILHVPQDNVCLGRFSCDVLTTGFGNTLSGHGAGRNNLTGSENAFYGTRAGEQTTAGRNSFMGYHSGRANTVGTDNVLVGFEAGTSNTFGISNTYVGSNAGRDNNGSGNVFIGANIGDSTLFSASNMLYIDNSNTLNPLIYGDFSLNRIGIGTSSPTTSLDVAGSVHASGNADFDGDLGVDGNNITFGIPGASLQVDFFGLTIVAGTTIADTLDLFSGGADGARGELRIGQYFEAEAEEIRFRDYQTAQDAVVIDTGGQSLMIGQELCVGRGFDGTLCTFNAIGNGTNEISVGAQGLYVTGGLEVDSSAYFGGSIHMDDNEIAQDHQQWIYFYDNGSTQGEWFQWDPAPDRFRLTDDLKLDGAFIEGRDAGNFEILSTASLHLQADTHVRTMIDDDNTTTAGEALWYSNGQYNSTGQLAELQEDGDFRIGGTLSQNVAFDIAESFLASEPLEAGDIVRLDPDRAGAVLRSTGADDTFVLGVISSKPGMLLGSAPFNPVSLREVWGDEIAGEFEASRERLRKTVVTEFPEFARRALEKEDAEALRAEQEDEIESLSLEQFFEELFVPVALAGRVPVKVDASLVPIQPGDALSPGPTPGVAVRSDGSGPVIGTALESMTEGVGKLLAFVHRGSSSSGQLATELEERTPDPLTGVQTMPGNFQIVLDSGADEQSRFSIFRNGNGETLGDEVFRVDEEGNVYSRGSYRPSSMDLAEYFRVNEPVESGDVLAVDIDNPGLYRKSTSAGDPAVVGIVSKDPGVLLGSGMRRISAINPELSEQLDAARRLGDTEEEARIWQTMELEFQRTHAAVALTGTVPIKVDAGYGSIRPGDLLMSSPTPGHAMRAENPAPGTILGKALEPLETGSGQIRMLVMLR